MAAFCIVFVLAQIAISDASAARAVAEYRLHEESPVFHTTWGYKDDGGVCQIAEFTGTLGELDPEETVAEFAARCRETVNALKAVFVVDPSCPQNPPMPQPR